MRSGQTTEAFLLRAVDYGEADRIVTLLTRAFGRAGVIARGARRSKRRFAGALSPFVLLNVEIRAGRGDLGTLSQAHVTRAYPRVLGELSRMAAGYAALELIRELTVDHEPEDAVFAVTAAFFEALDAERVESEELLLCFAVRLVSLLGFAPELQRCGLCGKIAAAGRAALFDVRQGHLVCRACGGAAHRFTAEVRARLVQAQSGDFVAAAWPGWPDAERVRARKAITAFVEERIGRPLRADVFGRR